MFTFWFVMIAFGVIEASRNSSIAITMGLATRQWEKYNSRKSIFSQSDVGIFYAKYKDDLVPELTKSSTLGSLDRTRCLDCRGIYHEKTEGNDKINSRLVDLKLDNSPYNFLV